MARYKGITQFYLPRTHKPYLPFLHKHSPLLTSGDVGWQQLSLQKADILNTLTDLCLLLS